MIVSWKFNQGNLVCFEIQSRRLKLFRARLECRGLFCNWTDMAERGRWADLCLVG